MIRLNNEHINRLYDFTREHYVYWYDLQTELVDHLASGIERRSEQYPELNFEKLLEMEFAGFGVHGFEDIIAKRRKALTYEYSSIILARIRNHFQWPLVLKSLVLVAIMYSVFTYWKDEGALIASGIIAALLTIAGFIRLSIKKSKRAFYRDRKWLLEDIILTAGGLSVIFVIPLQLTSYIAEDILEFLGNPGFRFVFSCLAVLYLRLLQIVFWVLPRQMNSILSERYKTLKLPE